MNKIYTESSQVVLILDHQLFSRLPITKIFAYKSIYALKQPHEAVHLNLSIHIFITCIFALILIF